jgi:uncharacterized protein YndB with AHSA1/START domain
MNALAHAFWRRPPDGTQLQLVRRYRQPIEKVWAAITTPARLTEWMGIEWLGGEGPLMAGGAFDYRFGNSDMESRGHVRVFEPPRVFEHSWFENLPPASRVRWSLEPDGEGCVLTLTHWTGEKEDGPRTAAGWTQHIETLAAYLGDPEAATGGGMESWRAWRDGYAAAFPLEARRDGRKILEDGAPALRFERRLAYPPAAVWAALVEPEALARWLQAEATIDPHVGGRFHLILGGGSSDMEGVIRRWKPPHVLEYTWPERAANGDSLVRFEVFDDDAGARLVLTHVLTGGGDVADFASGWHWHLDCLEEALEGVGTQFDRTRWSTLRQIYAMTL